MKAPLPSDDPQRSAAGEERWQYALEGSDQGVWDWNPQTGEVFFSDRWCTLLGYDPAEIGRNLGEWKDRVHPDDLGPALSLIDEHFAGRTHVYVAEYRMRARDGTWRWIHDRGKVVARDAAGRPVRMVGTHTDVTDRKAAEEALHWKDSLLRIAGAVARVGGWSIELPERRVLWSDEVCAILDYPAGFSPTLEEALALYQPGSRERIAAATEACLREGRPFDLEAEIRTARHRVLWVRVCGEAVRTDDGRVRRAQGAFQDNTTVRLAADELRESEERFRLLARATTDAVWDWDLRTNRLWWNEGYEALFGHSRAEVDPSIRSWTDFIHPDDAKSVVDGIHRVIDGGGSEWSGEYRFRRKDGRYQHVSDRGHVIRDATGRPVRMIGGMTDLTERRQAETKLREQAALLDKARDAIIVRDLEHHIAYWNKSAEQLYGWTAAEVAGRSVRELLYADPSAFDDAMAKVAANGEWTGEVRQHRKDGTTLMIECRWTLVRDEEGRPASVLAINTDITERRRMEQMLLRAQRLESIGTLAGGIAHDLNNLLAPIVMGIELLRRFQADPRSQPVIDNIERSARRGADLVKQVLSFARGVEGVRVAVRPERLVREVADIVATTFPKNIQFEPRLEPGLWAVSGDPTQLNQVLLNLCVNARDAMPAGGRLTVSAANVTFDEQYAAMNRALPAGRYVRFEVADTGRGMTKEVAERVFEPFFTTKQPGQGTGLGLATVLGIVRSHGGAVTFRSEPGAGSTFGVHLPAQSADAPADSPGPSAEPFAAGHGELILVVDDEEPIREIMRRTLENFNYRVLTAEDGAKAIGFYAQHRDEVAAVLTDMMMPVMDGPALIAALRHINPGVRVIATSGLDVPGNEARAAGAGVKHFLTKPYTAEAMLAVLRRALAEPGGPPPPPAP